MASRKKELVHISMTTHRMGHECDFTWRLHNLSLIPCVTKDSVKHEFSLHPECDTKWTLSASGHNDDVTVQFAPSVTDLLPGPQSYIGFLDRKGKFVLPIKSDSKYRGEGLFFGFKVGGGQTVTLGDGLIVDIPDGDTLVVKGKLVVPDCCFRTQIVGEGPVDLSQYPKMNKMIQALA